MAITKTPAQVIADIIRIQCEEEGKEYAKVLRWIKTKRGKHTAMVYMKLNEMGAYNVSRLKRLKWLEKHLK